jgi:predicted GH43/DUF377 family glycosyl hydrolase
MLSIFKHGIILSKTTHSFEDHAVLNPGVIKHGAKILMFYRAVTAHNRSSIGFCTLSTPLEVQERNPTALLSPEGDFESQGMEDPRVVRIDSVYYLSYTAYDGTNALGALASSTDLIHWKRHGIMVPQISFEDIQAYHKGNAHLNEKYSRYNKLKNYEHSGIHEPLLWDKNVVLFPRKVNGKFCFLHRIKPDIQIVRGVENLMEISDEFWESYFADFEKHILMSPVYDHEVSYIGAGCPPIETKAGWLLIYHAVHDTINGYVYSACAALLDLISPEIELARLPYPLFFPDTPWELSGEVNNVCFPTGALVEGDSLYIYYGAADEQIAVASLSLSALLFELSLHPSKSIINE